MSGLPDRDTEICTSILRNLEAAARDCEQLAPGYATDGDTESAIDMHTAALRYRQLAARAMSNWADADQLTSLCANAAVDAETLWCPTPASEEIPRVR